MKRRDIFIIIASVVVVLIVAGLLYRYLAPPSADSTIQVEIPHPVDPNFNEIQLNVLKHDVRDYSQDITPKDSNSTRQ